MSFLFWSSKSACHADAFEHPASLNKITLFLSLGDLGFLDLAGERSDLIKGRFQFLLRRLRWTRSAHPTDSDWFFGFDFRGDRLLRSRHDFHFCVLHLSFLLGLSLGIFFGFSSRLMHGHGDITTATAQCEDRHMSVSALDSGVLHAADEAESSCSKRAILSNLR